ncbi:10897_t:CDS:2 [Dentiscutata heterogama]|uniref:10897_t:CDS:1 n=1 Tax=Dentiscutata heterogama TaxID=1316150 RepID=A0ACA9LZ88_9GLOM|nr:10897_t:CDS:2 [Dentiscutata heterogama]
MRPSKRVQFLKDVRNKKMQNAENNELFSDEASECESLGSELSGVDSSDNESPSSQSSSDENDWVDELFEPKSNAYTLMFDAANKPNAFEKTSRNGFYIGNAKSTIVNNSKNSSEEETSKYTLSELEQKIKNGTQDFRLQYTAQYLRLVESGLTRAQASNTISTSLNRGPWTARLIRTWGNQYTKTGTIQASKRGKHQKIRSLLLDEDIKNKLLEYLSFHKFKLSIPNLCDYVRDEIFPSAAFAVKKYKSHRRIPNNILEDLNIE